MTQEITNKSSLFWLLHQAFSLLLSLLVTDGGWTFIVLLLLLIPLNLWFFFMQNKLRGWASYTLPYLLLAFSMTIIGFMA